MQLAFEFLQGEPSRPWRRERLFFGILPDADACARIAAVRDRLIADHRLEGAPIEPKRLHISLHHVGDYPRLQERFVGWAELAARTVSADPVDVTLEIAHSFGAPPSRNGGLRPRPLVLLADGGSLRELHETLGSAMRKVGLRAGTRFVPHMTLLYGPKAAPTRQIEPLRFAATHFSLIHSERGLRRYNVLNRWPLRK